MKKIVYLFPTNRQKLITEVKDGISPDNNLYGFDYLQNSFKVMQAEIPANLERILNILFLPVVWIFNSRFTKLNFGRVILALPQFWQADIAVTCVDSVNKAAAILKKFKLFHAPLICMAGNVMDETEKFPRLHQLLWSGMDRIITHAPVDQEKLVRLGLGDKGLMIPVGSDARFFQKRANSELRIPRSRLGSAEGGQNSELVVSVGADRDRDYKTLFEAARKLPKLRFTVCCGHKNIEGLKIPDNVEVRVNVSALETRKILSKARMVVIPLLETHRASGQLALLDAMLMGKPIIISKIRGVVEPYGLVNRDQVLLSPSGDVEGLVQAVKKLQGNENLRSKLGIVAKKLAFGYTTEKYAEKLKRIVEAVTN